MDPIDIEELYDHQRRICLRVRETLSKIIIRKAIKLIVNTKLMNYLMKAKLILQLAVLKNMLI